MIDRRYRHKNYNQLPDGESSFNVLFYGYRIRAQQRSLWWELTREEFRELTTRNCVYCGAPPNQVRKTMSAIDDGYTYTGIDRIDPRGGYTPDNVVACCGICNRAKSDMNPVEWRHHIKLLAERVDTW